MVPHRPGYLSLLALLLVAPHSVAAAGSEPSEKVAETPTIQTLEHRIRELKSEAEIAQEEASAAKKGRDTSCAFNVLQAVNFLARAASQIHVMAQYCPLANPGQPGYVTAEKTCLIQTSSLVTSLSQIALGLSVAADRCQLTTNIDALCAAPIAALFTPASQFIGASTAVSATCAKEAEFLPKEIEIDRRLRESRRLQQLKRPLTKPPGVRPPGVDDPVTARKWQLAECGIDVSSAIMAMGQIAIGLNGATRSCPTIIGEKIREDVSKAVCTVDAGYAFFSFARLVLFIAAAVEHCVPGRQSDALCLAGVSSLLASSFGVAISGASIYLNCQLGMESRAILAGTSTLLTQNTNKKVNGGGGGKKKTRRLSKDELMDELFAAAGFSRRLSKHELMDELTKGSNFSTGEELWQSLGYNLSDSSAPWLQDDPEGLETLGKGQQMMKDLQTQREEMAEELLERGPEASRPTEVPEVLVDPRDDEATLKCSEKGVAYSLDLPGHATSLEPGAAACQSRCAKTRGCARFSYWPPDRHCRLHGILADPVPGQGLWISGPPGCQDAQISNATRRILKRKHDCYHPHAAYELGSPLAEPVSAVSIEDCQHRCQELKGCAYFTYSETDGLCSFSDKSAVKLQPVMYSLAGPRHCKDVAPALTSLAVAGSAAPQDAFRQPIRPAAFILIGALCGVAGTALIGGLLSRAGFFARKAYARTPRVELSVE